MTSTSRSGSVRGLDEASLIHRHYSVRSESQPTLLLGEQHDEKEKLSRLPDHSTYVAPPGSINGPQYSATNGADEDQQKNDELLENREDAESIRQKNRNLTNAIAMVCLYSLGFIIFDDSYNQWIYARYEAQVLGPNFSKVIRSVSDNPCVQGNVSKELQEKLDDAQSQASEFLSWTMVASLTPAVFSNILLGAYSDRIGRRPYFILPVFGYLIKQLVTCAVAYWVLDMRYNFLGLVFEGLGSGTVGIVTGLYLYTADNTTSHSKSRSFFMVFGQGALYTATGLAHFAVGYFINDEGYLWPMVTGSCIMFLTLLWGTFGIPETLHRVSDVRRSFLERAKSVLFSVYFDTMDDPKYKRWDFIFLLLSFFIWGIPLATAFATIFLMNTPLCWSAKKIAYLNTFKGLIQGLGSMLGMPLLQLCLSDEWVCVVGLIFGVGSRVALSFATVDWLVYFGYGLSILEMLVFPVLRAIFSRMVSVEKRGSLFASLCVIEVFTIAVAGSGINTLYAKTVTFWPGFAFAFMAGCVMLAAIIMAIYACLFRHRIGKEMSFIVEVDEEGAKDTEGYGGNGSGEERRRLIE